MEKTSIKTYSELIKIENYEERLTYLQLNSTVCLETFGYDRYLNQQLYNSRIWKDIRNKVILRDKGNDLADPNYPILGLIIVHHIEPITINDLRTMSPKIFDLGNLISCSLSTHNRIHYKQRDTNADNFIDSVRRKGDTKLW